MNKKRKKDENYGKKDGGSDLKVKQINKQTHAHQEYMPFITNYIPKVVVRDGKVTRKMQRNHIEMWW